MAEKNDQEQRRRQRLDLLADSILYEEAQRFIQDHPPPRGKKQLVGHLQGLSAADRKWSDLVLFLNNQRNRESLPDAYRDFYKALHTYLTDGKTGLRIRAKSEFGLVDADQPRTKAQEREALDTAAQELAQIFIQHLVAATLVQLSEEER